MEKKFILIYLLLLNLIGLIHAQDIFYPEIEPYLNANQKQELEKSVNLLLKARGNENNANDIESKYSKLKKRGSSESWKNKTWEAKEQKILAEKNYKQAYKTISDVYSSIITNAKYLNETYKQKALSLNKKTFEKLSGANSMLSDYEDLSKELLQETDNDLLDSLLHESHNMKLTALNYQIEALQIFISKGTQLVAGNNDDIAWEKAKKSNTIDSYYEYLNNNPRGKHMLDANEFINEIEKQSSNNDIATNEKNKNSRNLKNNQASNNQNIAENNENDKNTNTNENLKFKVQIAASKIDLSTWILNAKAPGLKNIEKLKTDEWIKYMVGEFSSYHQAAKFRDEIRSNTPDAFIVVFNNGIQIPVTNNMKN